MSHKFLCEYNLTMANALQSHKTEHVDEHGLMSMTSWGYIHNIIADAPDKSIKECLGHVYIHNIIADAPVCV